MEIRDWDNPRLSVTSKPMLKTLKLAEDHLEEMRLDRKHHPIQECPVLDEVRQVITVIESTAD